MQLCLVHWRMALRCAALHLAKVRAENSCDHPTAESETAARTSYSHPQDRVLLKKSAIPVLLISLLGAAFLGRSVC